MQPNANSNINWREIDISYVKSVETKKCLIRNWHVKRTCDKFENKLQKVWLQADKKENQIDFLKQTWLAQIFSLVLSLTKNGFQL